MTPTRSLIRMVATIARCIGMCAFDAAIVAICIACLITLTIDAAIVAQALR